jgi:uncharacterized protein (TIGR02677 family)
MERVPPDLFRFSVGDHAGLYTAILHAFAEANERLETSLSLDQVRGRLRALGWFDALADDDLSRALGSLREWRLVEVTQNHAENYRSAEEYERRNLQYSLTRRGEAAFAGVQHALTVLASTGALQTAVLDAVADRLGELLVLLTTTGGTDRKVCTTLTELETHLDSLRTNTRRPHGPSPGQVTEAPWDPRLATVMREQGVAVVEERVTGLLLGDLACEARQPDVTPHVR